MPIPLPASESCGCWYIDDPEEPNAAPPGRPSASDVRLRVSPVTGIQGFFECFTDLLTPVSESTGSRAPVVGGSGQRQRVVESLGS